VDGGGHPDDYVKQLFAQTKRDNQVWARNPPPAGLHPGPGRWPAQAAAGSRARRPRWGCSRAQPAVVRPPRVTGEERGAAGVCAAWRVQAVKGRVDAIDTLRTKLTAAAAEALPAEAAAYQ